MLELAQRLLLVFCSASGVVLGAAAAGSVAAVFTGQPPMTTMIRVASDIKLWAILAAIGGSFTAFEALEVGLFRGQFFVLMKQFSLLAGAFLGAHFGFYLISLLAGNGR